MFISSTEPFLRDKWLLRYLDFKFDGLFFDSPCINDIFTVHHLPDGGDWVTGHDGAQPDCAAFAGILWT